MEFPFFCNLGALSTEQRARHHNLARLLRPLAAEITELPDGYGVRFRAEAVTTLLLAEFLTLERLCCPFFALALELEPDEGPLWLKIRGGDGVKPFIRAELGLD